MTRIVQFWSFAPIIDQPLLASLPELEGAKVLLEPLDCGDMTIAFVEEEGIAIELIERH